MTKGRIDQLRAYCDLRDEENRSGIRRIDFVDDGALIPVDALRELLGIGERNEELAELLRQARKMLDDALENNHPGFEVWKALDDGIRAALEDK